MIGVHRLLQGHGVALVAEVNVIVRKLKLICEYDY